MAYRHFEFIEKHAGVLGILTAIMVSLGGLAEILPTFVAANRVKLEASGKPYDALRLAGRDVYVREGCYLCHSQMIRALRFETQRYGHFSTAEESIYDRPFQWGSKRNGPDLARVGGKYSDDWQRAHLNAPRSVVPGSIMPNYSFLFSTELKLDHLAENMKILQIEGVPYTDDQIVNAMVDARGQSNAEDPNNGAFAKRWPTAAIRTVGSPGKLTEADALVAYLQMLGTLVDFKLYDAKANLR